MLSRLFGYDVFVSYSSRDRPWAIAIEDLLTRGRYRVFRDDSQLKTGDHLDRLLNDVHRSTMLMVLVSENSMVSDWVFSELQAHLERPRDKWRVAPIFLDPRYPRELPEHFKTLGDFHGVMLPATEERLALVANDGELLADLTSDFRALRRRAVQWLLAGAVALIVAGIIGSLLWRNQRNTERDVWLKRADLEKAAARHDLAEADLARAWRLDSLPSTLAAYQEARVRRALEHPVLLKISHEEGVVAVGEQDGKPLVLIHSNAALYLWSEGNRTTLDPTCPSEPIVATKGGTIVWACGAKFGSLGGKEPVGVTLPAAPALMQLAEQHAMLLFREGLASQVGVFQTPALHPMSIDLVKDLPAGGGVGFCPVAGTKTLLWSFHAEDGNIVARRWTDIRASPKIDRLAIPGARAVWISRVIPARDCERFFIEYGPFTLEKQTKFEMVRIRPDSPRPVDGFDSGIEQLAPAPDTSGIEAIYLTGSKELRSFLLTSPVVLTTRVRTLASDIQRFMAWPSGDGREIWTLALDRELLTIYRNQELWTRLPSGIGEPVRIVPSTGGNWVVLEGESGSVLWRRARPWDGASVPAASVIEAETVLR